MFDSKVYVQRRKLLRNQVQSGLILLPGNNESPMNYPANGYHFRQDSNFLYFIGIDHYGLAAVIDVDCDETILYGDELTIDDIIWMGPQETLAAKAEKAGIKKVEPMANLEAKIRKAMKCGDKLHYLPQYRAEQLIQMEALTGIHHSRINDYVSEKLIKSVVSQRSIKFVEEIAQIEKALDVSYEMNKRAMSITRPGMVEHEVYGVVEGIALAHGGHVSFPVIYSVHGETLHNHHHGNTMKEGDLVVLDSGAESPLLYASDITRTYPVSGKFTPIQKDIYNVVLASQEASIAMMKPGVFNKDCHLTAAKTIAQGLKDLGFMKGDVDSAVEQGAHALFFPHGLGHMMGMDVHDMEGLGENYVGYDREVERSDQFGLAYLRLARRLQSGFVVTVEPGIYFIPELIDQWKAKHHLGEFINYDMVERHRDFGGIRIEDDILIVDDGHRVLGRPIAKTVDDVEAWCAS